MNSKIINRILKETEEILSSKKTIREISNIFSISKSTVHKDLHERLYYIDKEKYNNVSEILKYHIDIRHIRGGESTRIKYLKLR